MKKLITYVNEFENHLFHIEAQLDRARGFRKFRIQMKLFLYLAIPLIGVVAIIMSTYYCIFNKLLGN